MEILGSLSLAAANSNDQFRCQSWKRDTVAAGVMLDCSLPVNVTTTLTPTTADLILLLKYFLAVCSLSYGPSQEFRAFEGIDGGELRNIQRAMTLKEVPNTFVGTATGTGQKTFNAKITYWFSPVYASGRPKWLGGDICQTFKLELQEGTTFPTFSGGASARGAGACIITVVPIYRPGSSSKALMHPPNYRRINQSKLDLETPEGLVYLLWDDNAAYASTAIGKYSVTMGDDQVLVNVPPNYMNDEYAQFIDAGGSNISDLETILYAAPVFDDIERWPHGKAYLKLISQDVATLKARAIFWPEMTESDADRFASHIGRTRGQAVLLSTSEAIHADADAGYSATAPIEVVTSDDNAFHTKSGLIASANGETALSIPQTTTAAVAGVVSAAHGGSKEAAATKAVHSVSRTVPGAVDTRGNRRGSAKAAAGVHGHFKGVATVNAKAK